MEKFVPNHLHLLVKGECLNGPKNSEELNLWLSELVDKVGMKVVCGPNSTYVDDYGNEGVTGTVTLATSHSSFHLWSEEKPQLFQFDIYSCKDYSTEVVLEHLNKFNLISLEYIKIDRNGEFKIIEQSKRTY
jgi:S-adenosylmethionine/arginine decarboxylase-like enzyme